MTTHSTIPSTSDSSRHAGLILSNATASKKPNRTRGAALLLACGLIPTLAPLAHADYNQSALNRADAFLKTTDRGKEVLGYVHFGADYHGHKYIKTIAIDDSAFALVYRYWWEDDGVTDVAFICNAQGYVYKVQVISTNAVFSQPFLLANASISILGHSLIELYKDKLSDQDRRQLHDLVDKADAKGLLEFQLKLEQVLG